MLYYLIVSRKQAIDQVDLPMPRRALCRRVGTAMLDRCAMEEGVWQHLSWFTARGTVAGVGEN